MNKPSALARFAENTLLVRPGEGRRTALLFLQLLLSSAVFVLGRTVRDTLFLSRFSLSALPWMFVLYGVASSLTAVLYGRVADRMPRHKLIGGWAALGIATYLATWIAARASVPWVYPAFYVWSEVVGNLFIVQFWTLANDLNDARASKRLFGTIGAARVLGVVVVGVAAGAVVTAIGTEQLLFVLAGLMAAIALVAASLRNQPRLEPARSRRRGPPPRALEDPYVRSLAVLLLVIFTALTLGDYQFKAIARAAYREDDLARFFSLFYAGAGLLSFVFQIAVTPRLLARFGVGWGMSVMPSLFGAASAVLLGVPHLGVATAMKFADNGLQYTIHETTLQALYVPFAGDVKARTRALLDALVKPLAYGLGGVALVVLAPRLAVDRLALATLPLVVAWFAVIPLVRRRYLASLEATLSARGALALEDQGVLDADGRRALIRTLEHGTPHQALLALEQLEEESSGALSRALVPLASHRDPRLKAAALTRLAGMEGVDPGVARAALADEVAAVRAAAASAYAVHAGDEGVEVLVPMLGDPIGEVREAALAGLLRHGGVEGEIAGGARLSQLLSARGREGRVEAAEVLRALGTGAYRPLRKLLDDADPHVRRAALRAARGVADPRLVPFLVGMLHDPSCRQRAGMALVAVGLPAVAPLLALLTDENAPRAVRLAVPRLVRHVPHAEAYTRLRALVGAADPHLRLRVFAALSHLRRALALEGEPLSFVEGLVRREMAELHRSLLGWERARPAYATPLLEEELLLREGRVTRRILRVLELRYPAETLWRVRDRVFDPTRRANALEVLDTVLEPALRSLVMPFLDDGPAPDRLTKAGSRVEVVPEATEFVREMCQSPSPYVAMLALEAFGKKRGVGALTEACQALSSVEPLVREGALLALAYARTEGAWAAVAARADDPDAVVGRRARIILATRAGGRAAEVDMYTTAEKVLFLKSAPVFERVSGEDLAPLARVAELESYAEGQAIFSEGEAGDALFVVVRGKVAIASGAQQYATLGVGDAFGEMAALDGSARSATATALEETEVLRIGSEEFYEVLHEQVEIAEGVIHMLTRRLREADAALQARK